MRRDLTGSCRHWLAQNWPGTPQALGFLLGFGDLIRTDGNPNLGVMTLSAALIMFRRAVQKQTERNRRREEGKDDGSERSDG